MKNIIISALIISLIVPVSCSHKPDKDAIKVMTLNIRYDNPGDSSNSWTNRASVVCNFIRNEKPDLLGLQEVLLHQYEFLESYLSDYGSVGIGRTDGVNAGEMNPVFFLKARYDMTRTKTFWLSETPEIPGSQAWGAGLPRIVTWTELVDKNSHEHIFFFNTHFAHDSDSARIMSAKLILTKVDSIASGFPFIITGDFNMSPSSKGYKILTGPAESIPLLKDSYVISEKNPVGPRYTSNGFSDKQGSGRIDYIFISEGMRVLTHKTTAKKVHRIFISDHWPVEALVSLK